MSIYVTLLKKLRNKLPNITFVTTNYDMLIELTAAKIQCPNIRYSIPRGKKDKTFRVHILKIHGSPNFIPDNPPSITKTKIKSKSTHYKGPCKPVSIEEAYKFIDSNDSLAPAIAMYNPSKQVRYCPDYVVQQQEDWKEILKSTSRCIIIGLKVNVNDQHIWGELAKSKCKKYYVGDEEGFNNWKTDNGLQACYYLTSKFNMALSKIFNILHVRE